MKFYQSVLKRMFDIVTSMAGIVVVSPLLLVIMLLLKCTSRGPVFFVQERIGRFGVPFKCIKFRTMSVGAAIHGSVTAANDRRITPIGSILRMSKFDELPQLLNVLIGKMSLVGPRPDVPGYADKLTGEDRRILLLRPGITGPASFFFRFEETLLAGTDEPVSFNDRCIWPVKVGINRRYYDQWSFPGDLGYIVITVIPRFNRWLRLLPDSPHTIEQFDEKKNDPRLY